MIRISLLSRKGGVGKTLCSMAIAQVLSAHGRVVVLDLDPEGSAQAWAALARAQGEPLPFEVVAPVDATDIGEVDYLVVDTPPNDPKVLASAAARSDYIFIPLQPGVGEIDRLVPTVQVLREHAAEMKPGMRYGMILTMVERDNLSADMPRALEELGHPLAGVVRKSVEYRRAFGRAFPPALLAPFEEALRVVAAPATAVPASGAEMKLGGAA